MKTPVDGPIPSDSDSKSEDNLQGLDLSSPVVLEKFAKDVRKLELRIERAIREGRRSKAKVLQRFLDRSLTARTLAERAAAGKADGPPGGAPEEFQGFARDRTCPGGGAKGLT